MPQILLPEPRAPQRDVLRHPARLTVVVCGRRWGKSLAGLIAVIEGHGPKEQGFRGALERLGKDHEIHIYPGVGHAFANPTGQNYNAEAAEDAWRRTLEFLGRHLSSDAAGS